MNRSIHSSNAIILTFRLENTEIQCRVMVDVNVPGCIMGQTSFTTHIHFVPCKSAVPFLRNVYLRIWPWKCKVNMMGVRSKFKVTKCVRLPMEWRLYHSFSTGDPIPGKRFFKIWHWKSKAMLIGYVISRSDFLSLQIPFVQRQSASPFLRYGLFRIWPWKSKINVIPQGQITGQISYRIIALSPHVNRPSHSWNTAILNLTLTGQGHG